jgi:hypothetical protein
MPNLGTHYTQSHLHDTSLIGRGTRFYLHAALNDLTDLPTSEQSSLALDANADPITTNRLMDLDPGTGQIGLTANTIDINPRNYYFTRFVSPRIFQSSISANTWTYNFAAEQEHSSVNFPVSGTDKSVYVSLYVWRPSTQTKIGTIAEGNRLCCIRNAKWRCIGI